MAAAILHLHLGFSLLYFLSMKKILLLGTGVLLAGVLIGVVFWNWNNSGNSSEIVEDQSENFESIGEILDFEDSGSGSTMTEAGKPRPEYKGQSLSFLASQDVLARYPKEMIDGQKNRLLTAIGKVSDQPGSSPYWIEVGVIKKIFDNYIGARDAWEYAKIIDPNNPIHYFNLGNLYAAYLKDVPKAEQNYLMAVQLDSNSEYTHLGLADFYKDFYKEKSDQIDDVLLNGLGHLPKNPNLILSLAFYYRDSGRLVLAIENLEEFLEFAKDMDITSQHRESVEAELARLKSL